MLFNLIVNNGILVSNFVSPMDLAFVAFYGLLMRNVLVFR